MNKRKTHNKDSIAKTTKNKLYNTKRENIALISGEVDAFLTEKGAKAVYSLTTAIDKLKMPQHIAKETIKEAIKENIKRYNRKADNSGVIIKVNHPEVLQVFDSEGFIERQWQYIPFILRNKDYLMIQNKAKYPIFIDKYDYSMPLYKFKNNIQFQTEEELRKRKIQNMNDIMFYISDDEKMLFSKVINLSFNPISYSLIKQYKKSLVSDHDKERVLFLPSLYDRSFSISMYVMLDGDPKKTHMYLRYDSSSGIHKNVYIGNDNRQSVFGYEATNPHFHFQNEDDNLLCMKKFRDGQRHIKWKTGRCNAIDLKHLINYLIELDSFSNDKVEKLYHEHLHYNMPFLEAKHNHKQYTITNIRSLMKQYKEKCDEENKEHIDVLVSKFELINPKAKTNGENKVFNKLLQSLKFLQFLNDERINTSNLRQLETLSQLEIMCANDVMNSISNCKEKIIEKDYQPKYKLNGDYLNKDNENTEDIEEKTK